MEKFFAKGNRERNRMRPSSFQKISPDPSDKKVSPAWGEKILKWFLSDIEAESLAGDFEFIYKELLLKKKPICARLWFGLQILKSAAAGLSVRVFWSYVMIKNNIKIAFRNMVKHKSYSLINILGLCLGIICCILIFIYIDYESTYDRYNPQAGNIYRLFTHYTVKDSTQGFASVAAPLGPTLVRDYPEALDYVRIGATVKRSFVYEDKKFLQDGVFYTDNSFFDMFDIRFVHGDPASALEAPYTMVLTEETARKYFGEKNPVGETIIWDNSSSYTVTGVVQSLPAHSHFSFHVLASFATYIRYDPRIGNRWSIGAFLTYLRLAEGADPQKFEGKIAGVVDTHLGPDLKNSSAAIQISIQPLKKVYLLSQPNAILMLRAFGAIAVFILCIACFNFMNLSTARSANRAREVGMRKVLGAERKGLIFQFLGESFVYTGLALVLSILLIQILLPAFSRLAGREITMDAISLPLIGFILLGILVFVGLLAGSYPAFFLSAYKPSVVLRGNVFRSRKSLFRSILVVSQFAISTGLIICTMVIFLQGRYMRNKDLGFNKNQLLVIVAQNESIRKNLDVLKAELSKIDGVVSSCGSSMVPGETYFFNSEAVPEGFNSTEMIRMDNYYVDSDYLDTFEIDVIQGRGFSREIPSHKTDAVMINETAAETIGWENPVGRVLYLPPDPFSQEEPVPQTIIGVYRDIHHRSLYAPIIPSFIRHVRAQGPIENRVRRLTVRLDTSDLSGTVRAVERKWNEIYPKQPFYSFFLDDYYARLHMGEEKLGAIFRTFAVIAVFIGCLGLLGLAAYTAEQRTKEIGIRKVFGSTHGSVVFLLCRDFVRLILIAVFLAWPVSWFAMSRWLRNFPYTVKMGFGVFAGAALLTLVVALTTVGMQAYKAARSNPVDSLKYE
ncbi:MAG: ABC transporter permease [Candidatus Aminicenantes bacterium]|nr:ABC transporter permease [Candidatus Aminicenantes bacterium]